MLKGNYMKKIFFSIAMGVFVLLPKMASAESPNGYKEILFGMSYESAKNTSTYKDENVLFSRRASISVMDSSKTPALIYEDQIVHGVEVCVNDVDSEAVKSALDILNSKYGTIEYESSDKTFEDFNSWLPPNNQYGWIATAPELYWVFQNSSVALKAEKTTDINSIIVNGICITYRDELLSTHFRKEIEMLKEKDKKYLRVTSESDL